MIFYSYVGNVLYVTFHGRTTTYTLPAVQVRQEAAKGIQVVPNQETKGIAKLVYMS